MEATGRIVLPFPPALASADRAMRQNPCDLLPRFDAELGRVAIESPRTVFNQLELLLGPYS